MALWEALDLDENGVFGPAAKTPEGRLHAAVILRALYDASHIRDHLDRHSEFWIPRLLVVEPAHAKRKVPRLRYEKLLFTIHAWIFDDTPEPCNPCWIANHIAGDPEVFLCALRANWEKQINFLSSHHRVMRKMTGTQYA